MKARGWMLAAGMAMSLTAATAMADQQWSGGMMGMMGGPGMMGGCGMMSGYGPQGGPGAGMKHDPNMMRDKGMMRGPGMMGDRGMMRGSGMMHGGGMGPQAMTEWRNQSLQRLEEQLQLSAEQRPGWEGFRDVVESQSESMIQHHNRMYGLFEQQESMSLPERVVLHKEMMGERFASMTQFSNALTTFYQSLNAEQKNIIDSYPMMGGM